MGKIIDISGQKFGKLTVIKFYKVINKHSYWECVCECGKRYNVRGSHLRYGALKSCKMCSQIDDLRGNKFGYFKVISFAFMHDGNSYWNCVCCCGNEKAVAGHNLKRGEVKSCGCMSGYIFEQSCILKYGVDNPSKSKIVKQKVLETNMVRYGVPCTLQDPQIYKKSRETVIKKYGVDHPMKNPKIALKSAKSSNNSCVLKHWKTNEELVCQASYEKAVVEYLNKTQINFKWQHRAFKLILLDGKETTYRPDLYIIGRRKPWIEIKGYFRNDAKEKWDIFHTKIKPNSELWNEAKLKEMGIL